MPEDTDSYKPASQEIISAPYIVQQTTKYTPLESSAQPPVKPHQKEPAGITQADERWMFLQKRLSDEFQTNQIQAAASDYRLSQLLEKRNQRVLKARRDPYRTTTPNEIAIDDIGTARSMQRVINPKLSPFDSFTVATFRPGTDERISLSFDSARDGHTISLLSSEGQVVDKTAIRSTVTGPYSKVDTNIDEGKNMPPLSQLMREVIRSLAETRIP